jgi:hypothetical protein
MTVLGIISSAAMIDCGLDESRTNDSLYLTLGDIFLEFITLIECQFEQV